MSSQEEEHDDDEIKCECTGKCICIVRDRYGGPPAWTALEEHYDEIDLLLRYMGHRYDHCGLTTMSSLGDFDVSQNDIERISTALDVELDLDQDDSFIECAKKLRAKYGKDNLPPGPFIPEFYGGDFDKTLDQKMLCQYEKRGEVELLFAFLGLERKYYFVHDDSHISDFMPKVPLKQVEINLDIEIREESKEDGKIVEILKRMKERHSAGMPPKPELPLWVNRKDKVDVEVHKTIHGYEQHDADSDNQHNADSDNDTDTDDEEH